MSVIKQEGGNQVHHQQCMPSANQLQAKFMPYAIQLEAKFMPYAKQLEAQFSFDVAILK